MTLFLGFLLATYLGASAVLRAPGKTNGYTYLMVPAAVWVSACLVKFAYNHAMPQIFGLHPIHFQEALFLDCFISMFVTSGHGKVTIKQED